jgi:hypothetical protein
MQAEPFTRQDMVDAIATAISDSMDIDWNSHAGAEAVVRNCGVFEICEALASLVDGDLHYADNTIVIHCDSHGEAIRRVRIARDALSRVRGEAVPA